MSDAEKFEGLKEKLVDENEDRYGAEIREKYGDSPIDQSNALLKKLSQEEFARMEREGEEILHRLSAAVKAGLDPAGEEGQAVAALHRKWLSHTWPAYSREAHGGLVQMYTDDPRFSAYYDRETPGCAAFLRAAVEAWLMR